MTWRFGGRQRPPGVGFVAQEMFNITVDAAMCYTPVTPTTPTGTSAGRPDGECRLLREMWHVASLLLELIGDIDKLDAQVGFGKVL